MSKGVYYGKQESRVSKAEIECEIDMLMEELVERRSEGDVLLAMDGNGKIGLMGEEKSRNGIMLLKLFEEVNLTVVNQSKKCIGTVTRQNTKNHAEKSAIDFIVCSKDVEESIEKMLIDEEGMYKVKGTAEVEVPLLEDEISEVSHLYNFCFFD